ncbi:hypothetical protein KNE206_32900 [Kitasatospora sp. NE20-6]
MATAASAVARIATRLRRVVGATGASLLRVCTGEYCDAQKPPEHTGGGNYSEGVVQTLRAGRGPVNGSGGERPDPDGV